MNENGTSRFDGITRNRALAVIAIGLFAIVMCLISSRAGKPPEHLNVSGFTDPEVLEHIVDRVREGQNYYDAAGSELRADRFHVRSVFNWRQPFYAWFLAEFPKAIFGQALLGLLAIVMTFLAVRFVAGDGKGRIDRACAIIALVMVPGASYGAFVSWGATTLEIWAGVLIAISVLVYGEYWYVGVLIALLALFIRELAAPYIFACIVIAIANNRWRELWTWTIGLALYAGYFALHVSHVHASIRSTDAPDPSGWVQFGGLHFILTTAAQHIIFRDLPLWIVAIYLPLAVLGLLTMSGPTGNRASLTVAAYFLFFAVVGKSFNGYWGFAYSPLLGLGFSSCPRAAADLWNAISPNADGRTDLSRHDK